MLPIKYVYESNGNRDLSEEKQGFAMITLISASDQSKLTDRLVECSVKSGKQEMKIDYGKMSLDINKKNCPKVFNVMNPLTDEVTEEMNIEDLYSAGEFKEIYEEISNAVGDISKLKTGIKKK